MRNTFIGAAAIVYVSQIIDAAVGDGASRLKVKDAGELNVAPYAGDNTAGVALVFTF